MIGMATRQSLTQFERDFKQEVNRERLRRESLSKHVRVRSRKRRKERVEKRGLLRFMALMITIVATAVLVTVAMFETLAMLLG